MKTAIEITMENYRIFWETKSIIVHATLKFNDETESTVYFEWSIEDAIESFIDFAADSYISNELESFNEDVKLSGFAEAMSLATDSSTWDKIMKAEKERQSIIDKM